METETPRPFESHVGPNVTVPDSPSGAFFLFFTRSILEYIVIQSNKYALECMGEEKYSNWEKITIEELTAFMGFMILMGIVHLPSIYDYWKKDEVFLYSPIALRITRNQFCDIQRYLHFVENSLLPPSGSPRYSRLQKVQPIIDLLEDRFKSIYSLHRDVSINEAMIPFKGRSSMKQYMPLKPVKRGFKFWMLADAHTSYFSYFDVYTGNKSDTVQQGLGASIVKTLCKPIEHRYAKYI